MRWISLLAATVACVAAHGTRADDSTTPIILQAHDRPEIHLNRWQEDWSVLADPALRTEPLDNLKYIPLLSGDPNSYASLGLYLRERMNSTQIAPFGIGNHHTNTYLIQRLELHADIRPNANWQIFVQLQDDRAFGKDIITPVDENPLDVEQAFIAYSSDFAGGKLKVRVGRQQMAFDLQRFVGVRDGPNVRQSFDAIWADWEKSAWRFIGFWSHPVQNFPGTPFNDYSNRRMQYGGFRVERNDVAPESCLLTIPGSMRTERTFWMAAGTSVATIWTCAIRSPEGRSIGTSKGCRRPVESAAAGFEPGLWDRPADTRLSMPVGGHA